MKSVVKKLKNECSKQKEKGTHFILIASISAQKENEKTTSDFGANFRNSLAIS